MSYFLGYTCTLIHFYLLLYINISQHNFIHFSIMGSISHDLQHQLFNVHHIDSNLEVWFPQPLKVRVASAADTDPMEFVCIKKVGRSLKVCTLSSAFTLSTVHYMLQWRLQQVLLSMKDPRYPFDLGQVYEVDSIILKNR